MNKSRELSEKLNAMHMKAVENERKLSKCVRHNFDLSPLATNPEKVGRLLCLRCGGYEDRHQAMAYIRGFLAAGGSRADCMSGSAYIEANTVLCVACDALGRPVWPGAWSGDLCPVCSGTNSADRGVMVRWLNKEGKK